MFNRKRDRIEMKFGAFEYKGDAFHLADVLRLALSTMGVTKQPEQPEDPITKTEQVQTYDKNKVPAYEENAGVGDVQ